MELLSCPFCGGRGCYPVYDDSSKAAWYCRENDYNTRTLPDEVEQMAEALEKIRNRLDAGSVDQWTLQATVNIAKEALAACQHLRRKA